MARPWRSRVPVTSCRSRGRFSQIRHPCAARPARALVRASRVPANRSFKLLRIENIGLAGPRRMPATRPQLVNIGLTRLTGPRDLLPEPGGTAKAAPGAMAPRGVETAPQPVLAPPTGRARGRDRLYRSRSGGDGGGGGGGGDGGGGGGSSSGGGSVARMGSWLRTWDVTAGTGPGGADRGGRDLAQLLRRAHGPRHRRRRWPVRLPPSPPSPSTQSPAGRSSRPRLLVAGTENGRNCGPVAGDVL